ncbi:MAG: sulfite exporter TauE/SafE family protein [Gemmatimonadaceae bacterium]
MTFHILLALLAVLAGAVASVVGFGIGSLLTPLLAVRIGTQLAVAAISIPHVFATALRFWRLRAHIDRRVLVNFGVTSAAGGLTGALFHSFATNRALALVFGAILIFVGTSELSGLASRMRFSGPVAWIAGAVSGVFGGLVGNQGGIRSAALLGFDVERQAFVATATAIGLVVDAARMPVYFATQWRALSAIWPLVLIATVGALAGTLVGVPMLRRIPEKLFRRIVAVILILLGVYMLTTGQPR